MSELAIISVDKELDPIRKRNFFINIIVSNLIWMIFHFSVFFFFTFQLKSIIWVWFFLWIWNLFSFLLDISIWIIQKYFKPKTLFIISYIAEIIAMLIFINFTLQISDFLKTLPPDNLWAVSYALEFFMWKWYNFILLFIASFCYGLTKELQEVTLVSYILNNANPSQYTSMIANKNLATWIWSLLWLIITWFILTLSPNFIIFLTIFVIILVIYFTLSFFDNNTKTLTLQDIYKFKVLLDKNNIKNIWNNLIKSVNKIELKSIINTSKYLFLKPLTIQTWLTLNLLINETKVHFISTYNVLKYAKKSVIMYQSILLLIIFWFWDTFAITFLIKFLDSFSEWSWYILLAIVAIPAFWLQDFFGKKAEKYWFKTISSLWLILSWVSLILMWVFAKSNNLYLIIFLALINSIWFAACMVISQWQFLTSYNKSFAEYNKLKEIDANASAAPFRVIRNLIASISLLLWWIILNILWYVISFIIFWSIIIYTYYWFNKNPISDEKLD